MRRLRTTARGSRASTSGSSGGLRCSTSAAPAGGPASGGSGSRRSARCAGSRGPMSSGQAGTPSEARPRSMSRALSPRPEAREELAGDDDALGCGRGGGGDGGRRQRGEAGQQLAARRGRQQSPEAMAEGEGAGHHAAYRCLAYGGQNERRAGWVVRISGGRRVVVWHWRAMPRRAAGGWRRGVRMAARRFARVAAVWFAVTSWSSRNSRGGAVWRTGSFFGGRASDRRCTKMCSRVHAAGKRPCGVANMTIRRCHPISVGHIRSGGARLEAECSENVTCSKPCM